MIAIAIILISIASLLLGVFHDHKAARARKSFFGLTRLGMSLVALSVVGLALGIAKQLSDVKQDDDRTQKLNAIYAKVVGEQKAAQDPKQAALLGSIGQQISDVANHRASNLPNNDFSYSYFDRGNFSLCQLP
jgi:hypothetical protein